MICGSAHTLKRFKSNGRTTRDSLSCIRYLFVVASSDYHCRYRWLQLIDKRMYIHYYILMAVTAVFFSIVLLFFNLFRNCIIAVRFLICRTI